MRVTRAFICVVLISITSGAPITHTHTHTYTQTNNYILILHADSITHGNSICATFGNDLNMQNQSTLSGLYLMTMSTAGCPGNATMWNACYYNGSTDRVSIVTFGVYRPSSIGNIIFSYTLVSGSAKSYNVSRNGSAYPCIHFSIPVTQQFTAQKGDIIGACIQALGSGHLSILGSTTSQANVLLPGGTCSASLQNNISPFTNTVRGVTMHVSLGM